MTNKYLRKMNPPPIAHHGAAFTWRNQWLDVTTGLPVDWTTRPDLVLTTTLKSAVTGKVLAVLSSAAGHDGTITGDADGWLTWLLPMAKVNALPITKSLGRATDPRVSIYRARSLIVFDLKISDGVHDPWVFFNEYLTVSPAIS